MTLKLILDFLSKTKFSFKLGQISSMFLLEKMRRLSVGFIMATEIISYSYLFLTPNDAFHYNLSMLLSEINNFFALKIITLFNNIQGV
jgi:hypothetical protein